MKRLAADLRSLYREPLPPYYLFDEGQDDMTQLDILLTGPPHTPFEGGLWKLHLSIPQDYPQAPPTAHFRNPIFHPNIDPQTGGVCVETLKRDWSSKLTLRDVLITISCLLIQPNPDSALNAEAGALIQDNYELFARRARMMTSLHAPVLASLRSAAQEAQSRGSDQTPRRRRIVDRRHDRIARNGSPNFITPIGSSEQDVFMSSDHSIEDQENAPRRSCESTATPVASAPRRPPGPPIPLQELVMDDDSESEYPPSPRKSISKQPGTISRKLFVGGHGQMLNKPLFEPITNSDAGGHPGEKRKHETDEAERQNKRPTRTAEELWKLCGQDIERWNCCDFDGDPFNMVAARW